MRRYLVRRSDAVLNLLFEGDSTVSGSGASAITSSAYLLSGTGSPGTDWAGLMVSLLRADGYTVTARNTAAGGSTMTGVNSRAASDDTHVSTATGVQNYAFLLCGYNDKGAGTSAATLVSQLLAWAAARAALANAPAGSGGYPEAV